MTAPARRDAAGSTAPATYVDRAVAYWRLAEPIRREWLDHGLDTAPADRVTTEYILSRIYARHHRPRPRFRWVDSPDQAMPLVAGLPTHDQLQQWVMARQPAGRPPLISDIVAGVSRLRGALDECLDNPILTPPSPATRRGESGKVPRKKTENEGRRWPVLPPDEALAAGVPLRVVLRQGVWDALRTSLADGFYLPVRATLAARGRPVPSAWYGQQDAPWIAYYDVARRIGLAQYRRSDERQLDEWAALARSAGWWWPGEQTCVLVERPAVIRTEPVPGSRYGERRLRRDADRRSGVDGHSDVDGRSGADGPIGYRDGWRPPVHRTEVASRVGAAVHPDGPPRAPAVVISSRQLSLR
ncbi:hypothetical protein O7632_26935 [Solwaraspora sp. WMMD406]|uniref:DUF6745 domain-containing protein n=1 Tax=Solwaraspora sp. WMMD406 TaxID=3016095 RepID=UPI0024159FB2|nr:hypothetical protein [Solwaraspora sp. WMMD406]MDG4767701.1 hypothetical protein [Solwaraspora sp. WMMD406]